MHVQTPINETQHEETPSLARGTSVQSEVADIHLVIAKKPSKYRSRELKSRSKLRAAIGLRTALGIFLLHQNSSLFTVTFGEKVLTLAKSRGS